MAELGKNPDSLPMHAVRQVVPCGKVCILCQRGLTGMGFTRQANIAVLGDDEPDFTVPGPLLIIVTDGLRHAAFLICLGRSPGRHHQTVWQCQRTNGNGAKQQ